MYAFVMPVTEVEGHRIPLTHLERILFPRTGTTKADLIRYYATIAPFLLPYVRGRPVSFVRTPEGVEGQHFFQRRPPAGTPDWVTVSARTRTGGGTAPHVQVDNL